MIAFSDNKKWPLTIITQEDSCLLFLSLDKFVSDYNNTSICRNIITLNLLRILSDYTISLNKKIDYLSEKSLRSKLSMYLMELYQKTDGSNLTIPMKRHELADYLNVSRPSLSKELGLMRDEGFIDFNGSSIHINDTSKLMESAYL
jgi:CRP-like cAMP-binding protein